MLVHTGGEGEGGSVPSVFVKQFSFLDVEKENSCRIGMIVKVTAVAFHGNPISSKDNFTGKHGKSLLSFQGYRFI